jgi:hypothetical protein
MSAPEIRLGGVRVALLDGRHFVFEDVHDPTKQVMIDDSDVAELIVFLRQESASQGPSKPVTPHSPQRK